MNDQNPHACSDGGCIYKVRSRHRGMGTNGGCHCIPRLGQRVDMEEYTRLRLAINWMREEIERLDKAAKEK